MKAKITGMSSFQGAPIGGTLTVWPDERYEDGEGNATPGRLDYVLDVTTRTWRDAYNPAADAYLVVAAPGGPEPITAIFEEQFEYADGLHTPNLFRRFLVASDLDATEFDYTQPQNVQLYNGGEPLTMRAARQVVAQGPQLEQARNEALAVTGINPAYVSETTADPPPAPANGTKGSKLDEYGNRTRLEWQGGMWLQRGVPVLTRDGQVFVDGRKFVSARAADNRAYLQDAVDYVAQQLGAGIIVLPRGVFAFRGPVAWKSFVGLAGQGPGATILSAQGQFGAVIEQYGAGPTTGGAGAENAAPLTNVTFRDFEIDGSGFTFDGPSVTGKGFFILYMRRALFDRLYIHHTVGTGLGCDFLTESVIRAVVAEYCGRNWDGVRNPGGQSGIGIGTGWKDVESVTIESCHTNFNGNYGIFVETQEGYNQTRFPKGARILGCYSEGNRIGYGNKGSGGTLFAHSEARNNTQDGFALNQLAMNDKLVGCVSSGNGRHGLYIPDHQGSVQIASSDFRNNGECGVRVDNQGAKTMKGFHLTGGEIVGNGKQGVVLAGGVEGYSVKAATIRDNGKSKVAGARQGIQLGNTLINGEIKGNSIGNSVGNDSQAEPVAGSALNATRLSVLDNDVSGTVASVSALFSGLNGTNVTIDNNPGYNDQAVPDTLAPAASPWAYTAGKSREQLYLIGTGITVNIGGQNVTSNATSAQITLPANKQVTITYTAMTAARRMRI